MNIPECAPQAMDTKKTARKELDVPPPAPSRLERVKQIANKIKDGGKELLDHGRSSDSERDEDSLFHDAAFNPQMVLDGNPHKLGSVRDKMHRGVKTVAEGIKNPRRAVRNRYTRRAAANLSKQPDNYIGVFDEELLDAHDQLFNAMKLSPDPAHEDSAVGGSELTDVEQAQLRIDEIEDKRESRRNAWIIGRHVFRAKVVRPMSTRPMRSHYLQIDTNRNTSTDWSRYLARLALWYSSPFTSQHIDDFSQPPFDLRELALTIERLAVISTSWQSFLVDIRNIYRWRTPRRTFRIMCLYWTLWYFQQIIPFTLLIGMFLVIKNKFRPTNVASIRKRVERTRDVETKARAWNELIQRHGNQDWIEPLLDEMGPLVQMQLDDLANLLEILQNFYRWERPRKTIDTLFFFLAALLVISLTDAEFCLRLFWMGAGAIFFFSFPISTNFPKYRHIVSPLLWVFWDVPNAADLAIIQLQEKSLIRRAAKTSKIPAQKKVDSSDGYLTASEDYTRPHIQSQENNHADVLCGELHTFRAVLHKSVESIRDLVHSPILQHTHSRLTLTYDGIWLYNAHEISRFYHYTDLLEMRKVKIDTMNSKPDISSSNHHDSKPDSHNELLNTGGEEGESESDETTTTDDNSTHQQDKNNDDDDNDNQSRNKRNRIQDRTTLLARKMYKWSALQVLPSGLEFHFSTRTEVGLADDDDGDGVEIEIVKLVVSEADRDKIFSLVLGWSNLKWRPLFSMGKQNRFHLRDSKAGGHKGLDDALKRALR